MKRLPLLLSVAITLVLVVVSCGKTPRGIISPDDMAELMADIHTGEAVADNSGSFRSDSLRQLLKQSILARHGVTTEQFDTSLYWYGAHTDVYMEVNEKTIAILQQRLADAEKLGATEATVRQTYTDADSAVVWNSPSSLRLTPTSPLFTATFDLRSDRGWERGDVYTLSARQVKSTVPVKATLAVNYDDGTVEYVESTFPAEPQLTRSVRLYLDSAKVARHIYGAVTVLPVKEGVVYLDSISLVRTRSLSRAPYDANSASQYKVSTLR